MSMRFPSGFNRPGYDPLKVPDAPTGASATGGDQSAFVSFTPPSNTGGSAVSAYYAVSNPDQITATGASSPVSVTGLTNGTSYTFTVWALNTYGPSPYSAASGSITPAAAIALFAGNVTDINTIQQVSISSLGNATDFGDLIQGMREMAGAASSTRGVFSGGQTAGTYISTIQYVTFASAGNAENFGNLIYQQRFSFGLSNATRGIIAGGQRSIGTIIDLIQYITIASTGNSTNFGSLTLARYRSNASFASPTRGVFCAGIDGGGADSNIIDYITIASTGNATDFGDLISPERYPAGFSSNTRGIIAIGSGDTNVIEYVTIASTGNATDFGDLSLPTYTPSGASNNVRGLIAGNYNTNSIQYITIESLGNSQDFGDLMGNYYDMGSCSNAHGGL